MLTSSASGGQSSSPEENAQVTRENIREFGKVDLLQFPHSCGGKLIEWDPLQNESGLLRREFCSLILILPHVTLSIKPAFF